MEPHSGGQHRGKIPDTKVEGKNGDVATRVHTYKALDSVFEQGT